MHIFNNMIGVFGYSFEISEEEDRRLAEEARLLIEPLIPKIFRDVQALVDSIQRKVECTRAVEAPRKRIVTFDASIPRCVRGKNKTCCIESFIKDQILPSLDNIKKVASNLGDDGYQFNRACDVFASVAGDGNKELSQDACRRAGDCLIGVK
jgi:hypothetical protein